MRKLTTSETIVDRVRANIIVREEGYLLRSDVCGFVLSRKGSLSTQTASMAGTFSACITGQAHLSGDYVLIELPGVSFPGVKLHEVQPGLPGELSYIDGCSNTNLISPLRNGDPCTNYLYFPPETKQTLHTHPTFRLGLVLTGSGRADLADRSINLTAGDVFFLDRFTRHRFCTDAAHMSLMVFHPDSEDGPTDEFNPMKRRTYLENR